MLVKSLKMKIFYFVLELKIRVNFGDKFVQSYFYSIFLFQFILLFIDFVLGVFDIEGEVGKCLEGKKGF